MDKLWYQSNGMLYFCGDTIGWVTCRTHSSITYSTSIAQEVGHYSGAGKTMIIILAARHKQQQKKKNKKKTKKQFTRYFQPTCT